MYRTLDGLPAQSRATPIAILSVRPVDAVAVRTQGKVAHRNMKGRQGLEAHGSGFTLPTDYAAIRADLFVDGLGIVPKDRLAIYDRILLEELLRTARMLGSLSGPSWAPPVHGARSSNGGGRCDDE